MPTGSASDNRQWQRGRAAWLYDALQRGSMTDRSDGNVAAIAIHRLGDIPLGDGRLCACDPYVFADEAQPFATPVEPDEYPVYVALAEVGPGHHRVAAALVVFASGPIVEWTPDANDELAADAAVGTFNGYPVDAGTGCFASPAAVAVLGQVLAEDGGMLGDPVSTALQNSPVDAVVAAPRPGADPVAVFTSGWGDGAYATWFGRATDGTAVVAVTDFGLFADPGLPDDDAPSATPTAATGPKRGLIARILGR